MKFCLLCCAFSVVFLTKSLHGGVVYYGSSNAVLPAKNQEMFLMGFELGVGQYFSPDRVKKMLVVRQDVSGNPLGALRVADEIFKSTPPLVVGFPTSHEAMLVAKKYGNNATLILFAGAGHSDLATFGETVHTTGESMSYSVNKLLEFSARKFGGKKGAVIGNPFSVFSKNQDDYLAKQFQQQAKKPNLEFFSLQQDKKLSARDAERLMAGKFTYLVLSPYPDDCVSLLEQLEGLGLDLPIIANSSWTTGDVDYLRRLISKKKAAVYAAALWLSGTPASKKFEALVRERFGREATSEIAYGFDLGSIVGQTLISARDNLSKENILKVFLKAHCFDNLASGRVCFQRNGGHADRKIIFVRFTNKGFIPEE
jgi:ABC-type branched-subunit amino acid transport system substrate-binding protein